jgi:DNA-binding transcriptional MerR regulator
MEWDVSEFAAHADVSVDTIRYYQSIGLLHPPLKRGRCAVYDDGHVERLERIRAMAERGFSLKAIAALLEAGDSSESDRRLLTAIVQDSSGPRYSSAELARRAGISRAVLASVEKAGLAEAELGEDGRPAYTDGDLRVAKGAARLLGYGFPLTRLIGLGIRHDRGVRKTVDQSIDLFDEYVRKADKERADSGEAVADAFRELLPVVTALVAHHFQRVLVNRALKRLRRSGAKRELDAAIEATRKTRIGLRW